MTNVIYFVAPVTVILCATKCIFLTHDHTLSLFQNYHLKPDYLRNKQTMAQLKVAIFTGV